MRFCPLEKLHHLHDGYLRTFRIEGRDLLLVHDRGKSYLITNRCPHMGASLSRATLCKGVLRCPKHGIEFDVETGKSLEEALGVPALEKHPIVYENNHLGIML